MWASQSNNQLPIGYDPHADFPWDLRGFEEVPAYQNAQQPFLLYHPHEQSTSQLFTYDESWAPAPCPEFAQAYPLPIVRAPSSSPNYSLLSLSPATPSPSTAFTGSLPTSPDPLLRPLPPSEAQPRLRIPQTPLPLHARRSDTIRFEVRGSLGIRVCDGLSEHAQPVLDSSGDHVLERTGVRQIHLMIDWPGYRRRGSYVPARENGIPITRGRLACLVCQHIKTYVRIYKRAQSKGHRNQQWAFGSDKIRLEDLWLTSIVHDGNVWRPEIEAHVRSLS
ncbi:uncharacterized protein C8Q71DRAFT_203833 [Rhodofomes roseus]|uniref:Uncharacterized protein n=1 Tax=Rhodofomes roseus TaxID=34475 RepID=A0ABQ8KTW4_9APHY|nr:uncharacterized protein C8Q71DRAFT_203833 [Rhodofomes roseus]KAH9842449.1 hypothetical protein C8Q71DRAFT_203833 [Rhodofomes roseus]